LILTANQISIVIKMTAPARRSAKTTFGGELDLGWSRTTCVMEFLAALAITGATYYVSTMASPASSTFHDVLKAQRNDLISRWMAKSERSVVSGTLPPSELLDHMPAFVDEIIAALYPDAIPLPPESAHAEEHGAQRLRLGFDVAQVVYEYGLLGECILETAGQAGISIQLRDQIVLSRCLNAGIADALRQYVSQRDLEQQRQASEHIGFIAHEVRNPLSAARLAFHRLRQTDLASGGRSVDLLERNLRRTAEVIENALAQSSLKMGLEPKLQPIDLGNLLRSVQDDLALEFEARDISPSISLPTPGLTIRADSRLLRSALVNLVSNAIKFSREGSSIVVGARREDGQVTIDVADSCGGLPAGKAEELFAPLVQRNEDRSGYGLGLAIALQAAAAHAGTIKLRDVPGHGCVFSIVLPAALPDQPAPSSD
jgi:signal transduction histidine kinase